MGYLHIGILFFDEYFRINLIYEIIWFQKITRVDQNPFDRNPFVEVEYLITTLAVRGKKKRGFAYKGMF